MNLDSVKSLAPGNITRDNFDYINNLEFSEDGNFLLTSSNDNSFHIYNLASFSKERVLHDRPYGPIFAKLTRENNILYTNRKGKVGFIKCISAFDQSTIFLSLAHNKRISSIDLGIFSTYITASVDKTLKLWDLRHSSSVGMFEIGDCFGSPHCKFDPANSIVMVVYPCSKDLFKSKVKLIDLRNFSSEFATWDFTCPNVTGLELSDDSRYAVFSTVTNSLVVIDAINGNVIRKIEDYENIEGNCKCSISGDSKWLAVTNEKNYSVKVFDIDSGEFVKELIFHPRVPLNLAWNKNYGMLVSACWNTISWIIK